MALIETINASDLYNLACNMGRGKQFGYDGWLAIGDYLEKKKQIQEQKRRKEQREQKRNWG